MVRVSYKCLVYNRFVGGTKMFNLHQTSLRCQFLYMLQLLNKFIGVTVWECLVEWEIWRVREFDGVKNEYVDGIEM